MKESTLKIVLYCGVALSVLFILVGIIGAALGRTLFYAFLLCGVGMLIAVVCELVPLFLKNKEGDDLSQIRQDGNQDR